MISELDLVVLTEPIASHQLQKGDVGTVVLVLKDRKAFEVEFVTFQGVTAAVITLTSSQVKPLAEGSLPAANHEFALAA